MTGFWPRAQHVSATEFSVLVFMVTVSLGGFAWSYIDPDGFRYVLVVEDGFTEWATVVALFIAMLACLGRVWRLRHARPRLFLVNTMMLGIIFLFGAGEEISWGQRIIGFESSAFFETHNAQKETNLHNLEIGDIKINRLVFGLGFGVAMLVYLLVILPLYARDRRVRDWLDRMAVPVPPAHQVAAYLGILLLTQGLMESPKKGELMEFSFALLFMLTVLYPANRYIYRDGASTTDPARD